MSICYQKFLLQKDYICDYNFKGVKCVFTLKGYNISKCFNNKTGKTTPWLHLLYWLLLIWFHPWGIHLKSKILFYKSKMKGITRHLHQKKYNMAKKSKK